MSVIVEFSIPASEFILGKALQEAPGLSVELERVIPVGGATVPYFWVIGEDRDEFNAVLEQERGITTFTVVDELDGRSLYRVDWDESADTFMQLLGNHEAVLQKADGDAESWTFQLRFHDSHTLSEFHTASRDAGLELSVDRLYNPIEPTMQTTNQLTEAQRSLIEKAYDLGYFEVPRRITLAELSERLGVSDQAVNERMRRGLNTLIATTLKSGSSTPGE